MDSTHLPKKPKWKHLTRKIIPIPYPASLRINTFQLSLIFLNHHNTDNTVAGAKKVTMSNTETLQQRSHRDLNNRSIPGTIANGVLWPAIFVPFGFQFETPSTAWLCAAALGIFSLLRYGLHLNFSKLELHKPCLWLNLFIACSLSQAAIWRETRNLTAKGRENCKKDCE